MIVYRIQPMDFGWEATVPLEDYLATMSGEDYGYGDEAQRIIKFFNLAKKLAQRYLRWEGDFTQGPSVSIIPDGSDCEPQLFIIWKQSNNGDTFVACQTPISRLDDTTDADDRVGITEAEEPPQPAPKPEPEPEWKPARTGNGSICGQVGDGYNCTIFRSRKNSREWCAVVNLKGGVTEWHSGFNSPDAAKEFLETKYNSMEQW